MADGNDWWLARSTVRQRMRSKQNVFQKLSVMREILDYIKFRGLFWKSWFRVIFFPVLNVTPNMYFFQKYEYLVDLTCKISNKY